MDNKTIVFRCDASIEMGSGHVMRCLTLADELKKLGEDCFFICRELEGNLIHYIQGKGYKVFSLQNDSSFQKTESPEPSHVNWLQTTWQKDAEQTEKILSGFQTINFLIIDHYSLDDKWENRVCLHVKRILVIDDLADRMHNCDILLDQNYCRNKDLYKGLVKEDTQLLLGTEYSLLRPEFQKWRDYSLKRRKKAKVKTLLITMGGVDPENYTGQVLKGIQKCTFIKSLNIIAVLGEASLHFNSLQNQISNYSFEVTILKNVNNMAELMANSDIAIGAAGTTTWERCCLGLPTLLFTIAENQKKCANNLINYGVAKGISSIKGFEQEFLEALDYYNNKNNYLNCIAKCMSITDGNGANRVSSFLHSLIGDSHNANL